MIDRLLRGLVRAGAFIRALKGWPRFGFALAAGLVSAFGFAPFDFFPALLFGFAALVLLIDNACAKPRRLRSAFGLGWAFGFGQFLFGLHWIGYAFLVDAAAHQWQIPFVAVLFPGGLALFPAAAMAVAAKFWRSGTARIAVFTLCYILAEWLRGHILTGFPWNIPAYGWGASLAVLQSAALIGSYSLSLLTVLFGASLAGFFAARPGWKLPAAMAVLFALFFIGGTVRLAVAPQKTAPNVKVRLVQPNIPQAEKYGRPYVVRNWSRLIDLSRAPGDPDIVIWPEAAVPFYLAEQPLALEQITQLTADKKGLITGGLRRDFLTPDAVRYANSVFVFGKNGRLIASYDKSHLVPFGEYLPFEKTLSALGLKKLTGIDGSFAPGSGPHMVRLPGAGTMIPLVCYEIIFPGEVARAGRPDWFVNVTDDSWFGPWAGPQQHLVIARLRAIEQGVPVARAANTGISAIIDPYGRIAEQLGQNQTGFVDGVLPAAIAATVFSRFSGWLFWLLVCANVALTWVISKRKW